ncbi:MAG: hypothetical protein OXH34_01765 [Bacteroidetes bacterium]|nr:hypothetical protein [Bacteroidota bacterium]
MWDDVDIQEEIAKCLPDDLERIKPHRNVNPCGYFIDEYSNIYDRGLKSWIGFKLWPDQWDLLAQILTHGRICVLKGRQLGITWLCLAIALWMIVCVGGVSIALYSLREAEAQDLLNRLRGMFDALPKWMTAHLEVDKNKESLWTFTDNTEVRALSTTSGDSYQFNFGVVDEADLVPDLETLLQRLEPALNSVPNSILCLISRANKALAQSEFKKIYRLGKENRFMGKTRWEDWTSTFLSWKVRWYANLKEGTQWYEAEKDQQLRKKKHLDDLFTNYPSSDVEALAPGTANKRILRGWVIKTHQDMDPLPGAEFHVPNLISYECLKIYALPEPGKRYVIGSDCAEGLPTSNNSVTIVGEEDTGREVAVLSGTITPRDQARDTYALSVFYNNAGILVERNNHGHTVLLKLEDLDAVILEGPDEFPGYNSNKKSKHQLYNNLAEVFRQTTLEIERREDVAKAKGIEVDESRLPVLVHSTTVADEVMSIERATLLAPKGQLDDHSDAFALMQMARMMESNTSVQRASYMRA